MVRSMFPKRATIQRATRLAASTDVFVAVGERGPLFSMHESGTEAMGISPYRRCDAGLLPSGPTREVLRTKGVAVPMRLVARIAIPGALLLLGAACTTAGSDVGEANSEPTAAPAVVSSTTASTISAAETRLQEAALAETEITDLVSEWWTFPLDTSVGEAGLPLHLLSGALRERYATFDDDAATIQRARGGSRIEVIDVRVDLETGRAVIEVCSSGDSELVSAETGEVIAADDGDAWRGEVQAEVIDGEWKLTEFFSQEITGGERCELGQ